GAGDGPGAGQEAAQQSIRHNGQEQNERQVPEVALAEHDVLERAEIAQAGTAVIEDVLAAPQEAADVAGEQLLQNAAADAVVEQSVVAAVERPQAAEKARIVGGDDGDR